MIHFPDALNFDTLPPRVTRLFIPSGPGKWHCCELRGSPFHVVRDARGSLATDQCSSLNIATAGKVPILFRVPHTIAEDPSK